MTARACANASRHPIVMVWRRWQYLAGVGIGDGGADRQDRSFVQTRHLSRYNFDKGGCEGQAAWAALSRLAWLRRLLGKVFVMQEASAGETG